MVGRGLSAMSTGAFFITGIAGACTGFFAGQRAHDRHQHGANGLAAATVVLIILHAEVYGRHGTMALGMVSART